MVAKDYSETSTGQGSINVNREKVIQDLNQKLGLKDRIKLRILLKYLNRYIGFREFQRFYLDMIISKMRELVIEIASRMCLIGIIDEVNDVFYLDISDLNKFLSGQKLGNIKNEIELLFFIF